MRTILFNLIWGGIALCAPALTVVQDTLYKADGTRFEGIAQIEWKSFRAADGSEIPQNSIQIPVSNGYLNVALAPTTNASRPVYYTVRLQAEGRTQSTDYWSVPESLAPIKLRDVRTHVIAVAPPPNLTTMAIQDVSGLRTELDLRPIRGATWVSGRTARIGESGGIEAVIGDAGSCVHVDGTTGPCGLSSGVFVDGETPGGVIDGVNTVFQTSATPKPAGSLQLFRNGMLQRAGTEYTVAGNSIQFAPGSAPRQGDLLTAWYRISADSGYVFADLEVPSGVLDGSNGVFTLAGVPLPASSLMLYRNGLLQRLGVDYSLSLDRLTFMAGAIPQAGDILQATYRK